MTSTRHNNLQWQIENVLWHTMPVRKKYWTWKRQCLTTAFDHNAWELSTLPPQSFECMNFPQDFPDYLVSSFCTSFIFWVLHLMKETWDKQRPTQRLLSRVFEFSCCTWCQWHRYASVHNRSQKCGRLVKHSARHCILHRSCGRAEVWRHEFSNFGIRIAVAHFKKLPANVECGLFISLSL